MKPKMIWKNDILNYKIFMNDNHKKEAKKIEKISRKNPRRKLEQLRWKKEKRIIEKE